MHVVTLHVVYFVIGIIQDLLITYYYQTIVKEQAWQAAWLSGFITIVNTLVLYSMLNSLDTQVLSVIVAYSLGNGVGTFVVVKKHALRNFVFWKKKKSR